MFDGLVARYDLLNDVLSFGLDRRWRRAAAQALEVPPGDRVLDLGCGTGRLGGLLSDRHPVIAVDVSGAMLREARRTYGDRLSLVQGSAFRLPFPDAAFGGLVSAFVLRNLDDLAAALAEMARVTRDGGRIALVDITEPSHPALRRPFDAYFQRVAPALGALVGKRSEYVYLVESLAHLPSIGGLCEMLRHAGFADCRARGLTGGIAVLLSATRGTRRSA